MKIFPENTKQSTKYLLLIIISFGVAAYGINLENNIVLRLIGSLLFFTGLIGLIIEFIKWLRKKMKKTSTKKCQFCGEEILIDVVKCKHCGEWLNKQSIEVQKVKPIFQQYSNAQPVWHFFLLSILTFGIYEIYWFYRNWDYIKIHKNMDIKPGWRTAGLFVPIYGLVLIYRQLRDIRDFSREAGIDKNYSPGWISFSWIILNAFWKLPDPFWFLSFLSVWPLAFVQSILNLYWKKEQPELVERTKFSGGQIALIVIGGIWWILVFIGTFIPE